MNKLSDRVYVDSGESTPHLRSLLSALAPLCSELIEVRLGEADSPTARRIRLRMLPDGAGVDPNAIAEPAIGEIASPEPSSASIPETLSSDDDF